jgi:hypothetical protein
MVQLPGAATSPGTMLLRCRDVMIPIRSVPGLYCWCTAGVLLVCTHGVVYLGCVEEAGGICSSRSEATVIFSIHTLRQLSSWNSIVKWTAGRQQDEVAQLWNEQCQVNSAFERGFRQLVVNLTATDACVVLSPPYAMSFAHELASFFACTTVGRYSMLPWQ